jgi:hypothetical protein
MNNISTHTDFVGEAKHYGSLYHFTTLFNLSDIMRSNELYSTRSVKDLAHIRDFDVFKENGDYTTSYLSLTRNKLLHKTATALDKPITCRITLDGGELSKRHRIVPISYFKGGSKHRAIKYIPPHLRKKELDDVHLRAYNGFDEAEEAVILRTGTLSGLSRYITAIDIPTKNGFLGEFRDTDSQGEYTEYMLMNSDYYDSDWFDMSKEEIDSMLDKTYEEFVSVVKSHTKLNVGILK